MAEHWTRHRPPVGDDAVKSYQPKQVPPLTERLGHADVQALIARRLIHKSNLMTVTTPSPSDVSVIL